MQEKKNIIQAKGLWKSLINSAIYCLLHMLMCPVPSPPPSREAFMTEGQGNGKKTEDKYTQFQGRANTQKKDKRFLTMNQELPYSTTT